MLSHKPVELVLSRVVLLIVAGPDLLRHVVAEVAAIVSRLLLSQIYRKLLIQMVLVNYGG